MTAPVMLTPRTVDIEITSRCNLRCRYCYFFDNPEVGYRDLPLAEWLRFFDELGSLGVMDVVLAGGEPFLRNDLPALIEGIVRNRMRFSLLSNGTLVTDTLASLLARTGRCDFVQVSVDGSGPQTHDSFRGAGSFEGAVWGLRALQRAGVVATARVTIHRKNLGDLDAIARLLLEDLQLPAFSTNAAGFLGSCRANADEILLSVPERSRAMSDLLRLAQRYPGRITANAGPLAEGKMWREMEDARKRGLPPFPNGGRLTACGCAASKIAVRADGAIVPCPMLPGEVMGWINRDRLADAWRHGGAIRRLRERSAVSLRGFDVCRDCPYAPYCTGNCPGMARSLTGEVNRPSPDACLRRFLDQGGTLP